VSREDIHRIHIQPTTFSILKGRHRDAQRTDKEEVRWPPSPRASLQLELDPFGSNHQLALLRVPFTEIRPEPVDAIDDVNSPM
jgi:hypothetical protein